MPNPKPPDGYDRWLDFAVNHMSHNSILAPSLVWDCRVVKNARQAARAELSSLRDELAALKEENEKLKESLHNQRMESEDDA